MTTILADARLGVMVADSNMTDGDRQWRVKKVHRIHGALIGLAGETLKGGYFLDWYRDGMKAPPDFDFTDCAALVLDAYGLWMFDENCSTITRVPDGREAIGTGSTAAICAHEALGFANPKRAVQIVCRHDNGSRPPVRTYRL